MEKLAIQLNYMTQIFQENLPITLGVVIFLLSIHLINVLLGGRLNVLGIYSRNILSLPGIFFSPFLHGSFSHLFFNLIPLFVLLNFMTLFGMPELCASTVIIIFVSGLLTWLFGRSAIHIGSSSVVTGYFGFLLSNAYQHPSIVSIAIAILIVYYFSAILFSWLPVDDTVSWESHLFGLASGVLANHYVDNVITLYIRYG